VDAGADDVATRDCDRNVMHACALVAQDRTVDRPVVAVKVSVVLRCTGDNWFISNYRGGTWPS
jgi:hypothetical protein